MGRIINVIVDRGGCMLWINIANIFIENRLSGISRVEYEFCSHARKLQKQGVKIRFCTFDARMGFVQVSNTRVDEALHRLKFIEHGRRGKLTLPERLNRSFHKRLSKIKLKFGYINHPFKTLDVIIGVGLSCNSTEMRSLLLIKQSITIQVKLFCYDIIPINLPYFCDAGLVHLFSHYMAEAIRVADFFYCDSEHARMELLEYYKKNNITPPPTKSVVLGCDIHTRFTETDNSVDKLIKEPYLLFISTIEIRKNHELIYNMYLKLLEQGVQNLPKIYFIGKRGWKVEKLLHLLDNDDRTKDKIILLNGITDSQLVTLYKNCWFTLFPSFMEGYGLPVAESLAMGKYCLASNAGSLPEAGGEFIDYLSPYDIKAWCDKFLFLINNPDYIAQKEQYIKTHYQPVSWESFSNDIFNRELANIV